jgi:hypothetical protein
MLYALADLRLGEGGELIVGITIVHLQKLSPICPDLPTFLIYNQIVDVSYPFLREMVH